MVSRAGVEGNLKRHLLTGCRSYSRISGEGSHSGSSSASGTGYHAKRKSFLRSFVKRIEVKGRKLSVDYTMPLQTKKAAPPYREVLPFVQTGSSDRTEDRTWRAVFELP